MGSSPSSAGKRARYVLGAKGAYRIQIFVAHPPRCICDSCRDLRSPDAWDKPFRIRIQRRSIFPNDALDSSAYARQVKRYEEERLQREVNEAESKRIALGNRISVGQLCEMYRTYQRDSGKRLDRDRYRIDEIEEFFQTGTDAALITKDDYQRFRKGLQKRKLSPSSELRTVNTLLAIFNHGLRELTGFDHQLKVVSKPKVRHRSKPVTFSEKQVDLLLGAAMDEYERQLAEQFRLVEASRKDPEKAQVSAAPLRGFCLIAYLTLMRPENNLTLEWSQVTLGPGDDQGSFRLDKHKNDDKGVLVEGPLHPLLVQYLRSIRPSESPSGLIHPNPETGKAYATIPVKQWVKLKRIANSMLAPNEQLTERRGHFYAWRASGASRLAAHGMDPIKIVRMMGDTSLATVTKHYFDSSLEEMAASVKTWVPFGKVVNDDEVLDRPETVN